LRNINPGIRETYIVVELNIKDHTWIVIWYKHLCNELGKHEY